MVMKDLRSLVSEILTEVLTDRVYHYANVDQLKNIIQKDYFLPSVAFTSGAEEEINKGYKYFISFARNLRGTYHREGKGVGYLVVDGRKLSQKYKGGAVDYWQWGSGADRPKKTEAEDRLLTNKPYVKGATEFIDAVHISAPYATEIGSKMYTEKYSEGLVDRLRGLDEVARAKNIPVYFHTDLGSFRMANDKKAVDFAEWENGAVKAGVIEPSFTGGYKPGPRDLMRLEVVTKTIEELLVKGVSYKEFKDSLSEREREFLTRRFLYSFTGDDIAKKIIEAIRDVRDGEDDRPYIARIGRAMTKLKMNIAEMGAALGDIVSKAVRGLTEYPGDHDIDPDEPYGDDLFVAGDGETDLERFKWSQKTSAKLRSFVRNASTRNKTELHDILKQIQAMADEGTLSSYYDELRPPAGKVYRGMLVPAKAAESWGLIDPNNPPKEGKLQKKNNFVFKSSWYPSGLTSWSYSPDVASGFTALYSDETEAGEKYVSIVLAAEASDPGFILNHKNVKMLAVAGEKEVLFIGDEVSTTAYYKYYDGGTKNYEASEVDASELTEATKLPKEIFTAFEEEIMKSNFWDEDNDYEDLEFEEGESRPPQTPATMALTLAMNKALKRAGLDDVVGVAESSGDFSSNMWQSATIDVAEDGTPVFMVLMNLWEDFDDFGESVEEAVADISAAFRHELVHLQQLKAQAKSKGVGLEKAFTKMMDDPRQVVDKDQPKYWEVWEPTGKKDKDGKEIIKKDGFKSELFMKDYLERHIEIDAHAHQAGENLLRKYGEEKALDAISKDLDLDDPALPDEVKKYDNYKVEKKKMDKFRSKVYTYIKKFVEEQK